MRLCYVLLSPTWGMHQYTAQMANQMVELGHDVHLVTTANVPRDRYAPDVAIYTPVTTRDAGFSLDALRLAQVRRARQAILEIRPDLVHFSGVHLWNPLLLRALRRAGIATVHDLHDLHPHAGALYGRLLYLWNAWVRRLSHQLLVHGECFREELLSEGIAPERVTCTHLTFRCGSYEIEQAYAQPPPDAQYEPWVLFVGRLLPYKGLDVLVEAVRRLDGSVGLVLGGPGRLEGLVEGAIPDQVEARTHLIVDEEAVDLLKRCALMVLPYIQASNSGLIATAYSFCKPVIVTRTGALPEYVVPGETGWLVPPGDPAALARALSEALSDPARLATMGAAGRAWYDRARAEETAALLAMYDRVARG